MHDLFPAGESVTDSKSGSKSPPRGEAELQLASGASLYFSSPGYGMFRQQLGPTGPAPLQEISTATESVFLCLMLREGLVSTCACRDTGRQSLGPPAQCVQKTKRKLCDSFASEGPGRPGFQGVPR